MLIRKFFLIIVYCSLVAVPCFSQSKAEVGGWYMHACYSEGQDLQEMDKMLYYAVKTLIAKIDLRDNSMQILDKNAGLSDVGIRCLGCSPEAKMLVICYENSNVDLYNGQTIFNVPDIFHKQVSGNKIINKVFCDAQYAYLASGIGIIVIDLKKKVVKDTWFFKNGNQMYEVNDIAIVNDTVYAATDYGIFQSNRNNAFINNFAVWKQITNVNTPNNSLFRQFAVLNNTIYVLKNDTVLPNDEKSVIYQKNNDLWEEADIDISDEASDLTCRFIQASSNRLLIGTNTKMHRYRWNSSIGKLEEEMTYGWSYSAKTAFYTSNGETYIIDMYGLRAGDAGRCLIPGPARVAATAMDWRKSKLAVVHNTTNDWDPVWDRAYLSVLRGAEDWTEVGGNETFPELVDFIDVRIAPYDTSVVFVASNLQGLFEFRSDTLYQNYNSNNSQLGAVSDGSTRVVRLAFDAYNNLWLTCWTDPNPVFVLTRDGKWQSFSIPFVGRNEMGTIFADSRNWIWVVYDRENKVAIFNPDRSSNSIEKWKWVDLNLSLKEEEGTFTYVYTIMETKDRQIWLGTDKGIKIYYNPSRLLDEPNIIPQSIPVQVVRNEDTLVEFVLGAEVVRCIKADGGNRKWIGTENAGVFLLSPDGKTEIFHFTKDNSPLPSNTVFNITIDGETGDVYFGTDKGLIMFRYTATDPKENYEDLKIFPNPVREDFNGYISISGLKDNSEVKITDAFGKLVYRTVSNGGTAVWNGKRYNGQKVSTGVYFVFINETAEGGKDKKAGKILFIK